MRHGGDLAQAEAEFGRPADGWLDLSTGVNPHAYPVGPFQPERLTRLPSPSDVAGLLALARMSYGWRPEVPVVAGPGAQAMIQLLPYLRVRGKVNVVGPTYGEHAYAWARAGHKVFETHSLDADADVVIVVNPDNPTGRLIAPDALLATAATLAKRNGLLVVDESFADVTPDSALGSRLGSSRVVVLRSFGKFFGLAGVRLGFAAGDEETIAELAGELGPWPISGPALASGLEGLADEAWIATMRLRLTGYAMRLDALLSGAGFLDIKGCDLFRLARHKSARSVHETLAEAGIWCRSFDDRPDQLRFGLPGTDVDFDRLAYALRTL